MKAKLLIICSVLLSSVISFGQDSLVTKTFLENKVSLLVPVNFVKHSDKAIAERYPDPSARPSVIIADKEGLTSIKIIKMPQDVADNEVGQYKSFHMSNMKKEAGLEWLGDGMKKINDKTVGFFKVIYKELGTFSYFFFTSMDGKLLLLAYNCPTTLWPASEATVEKIVNSLKIL